LFDHEFYQFDGRGGATREVHYADAISPARMMTVNKPDLKAVKKRFIEVYVRKRPNLPHLPKEGSFSRLDLILGTYLRVITILFYYNPTQYNSRYQYLYPLTGISKNICNLPEEKREAAVKSVVQLIHRYGLDEREKNQILSYLM
jgi:hypothetical protein